MRDKVNKYPNENKQSSNEDVFPRSTNNALEELMYDRQALDKIEQRGLERKTSEVGKSEHC